LPGFSLFPRQEQFYDLFEQSSQNIVAGAKALLDLLEHFEKIQIKVEQIRELEHRGDTLTHQVMEQLHRTFVTPLDRDDIAFIAHALDDIMDFIDAAAVAMLTYKVQGSTPRAIELGKVILQSAEEVQKAIGLIRHGPLKDVLPITVEINRLENEADAVLRTALAELFERGPEDVLEIIKWRDIYDQLETATDRCEDVANVLEGIVIKHG